jgi:3-oxoacyl-[acyl-carrier protein] reductase
MHTRTALITGSGQNIGRAIALKLAENGFNIVVNGSSNRSACEAVVTEIESAGGHATIAMGNVGDAAQASQIAKTAFDAFGSVDVLINNAAIRPDCRFLEVDEAEWEQVMNVNYKAAFWLARLCLPGMIERGWGRIVNFTGMNAQMGYAGKAAVTVSKHAAWGLTKALAKEFGPAGVTTNIISPGTIDGEAKDPDDHRDFAALEKSIPVRRLGVPTDIAAVILMLTGDGGDFINGQMLQVNGGVVCQT